MKYLRFIIYLFLIIYLYEPKCQNYIIHFTKTYNSYYNPIDGCEYITKRRFIKIN